MKSKLGKLKKEFPELGFHFNVRNPRTEISGQRVMSMSCHSWAEVQNVKKLDYVTLSPVFDSISKKNYKANHSLLNGWREASSKVIAMGGVSLENLSSLKNFNGAAMLGTLDCSLKEIPFLLKDKSSRRLWFDENEPNGVADDQGDVNW